MAEAKTSSEVEEEPAKAVAEGESAPDKEVDWQAEAKKWKALSRKHEANEKALASKASEYDKYLESQKTEEQKRVEALQRAEKERDEANASLARMAAGIKYGLSEEDLALLGAGEDFEERAKTLAERLKAGSPVRARSATQGVEAGSTVSDDFLGEVLRSR